MKGQLHKIEFVYPPVSNQLAEWLKDNKDIQKIIRESNLYFIGQRPEMFFIFDDKDLLKNVKKLYIEGYLYSDDRNSLFRIDLTEIISNNINLDDIYIEVGPKIIKIRNNDDIIYWLTTESLLFLRSHKSNYITGLEDYRKFNRYTIHYVGISTKDDSLTRLVVKPHDKRLRILTNEHPFNSKSRLSDEITLFFCKITTLETNVLDNGDYDSFVKNLGKTTGSKMEIIADAEKAFIRMLGTQYNISTYQKYPKSNDGLYKYGINNYAYFIGESYSFLTKSNSIEGNYTPVGFDPENKSDFIGVDRKTVTLYKAQIL